MLPIGRHRRVECSLPRRSKIFVLLSFIIILFIAIYEFYFYECYLKHRIIQWFTTWRIGKFVYKLDFKEKIKLNIILNFKNCIIHFREYGRVQPWTELFLFLFSVLASDCATRSFMYDLPSSFSISLQCLVPVRYTCSFHNVNSNTHDPEVTTPLQLSKVYPSFSFLMSFLYPFQMKHGPMWAPLPVSFSFDFHNVVD